MDILIIVGVVVVLAFVFIMAALLMLKAFYFKVEQGKALIINGVSKIAVRFDGGFVWPIINKKELMRISLITKSDLFVINKTDLAPHVGANLDVMRADTERMRKTAQGLKPFVMTNLKTQAGVNEVVRFIEKSGLLKA